MSEEKKQRSLNKRVIALWGGGIVTPPLCLVLLFVTDLIRTFADFYDLVGLICAVIFCYLMGALYLNFLPYNLKRRLLHMFLLFLIQGSLLLAFLLLADSAR